MLMSRWSRSLHTVLPLMCLVFLASVARAESGYVNAREFARSQGMEYKDLSDGSVRAAKLVGNGREVSLFAGLRSAIVDGNAVVLSRPVQWDGANLQMPSDLAERIRTGAGATATVAPSPAPIRPVAVKPRAGGYKVVLDAGHGGEDSGAIGRSGLKEKDVNLDHARRVGAYLEARGVKVIYTRRSDVFIPLDERAETANRARADLFVSIHANANPDRNMTGAVVIYPDDGVKDRPGILGRAKEAAESREVKPEAFGAGGAVSPVALLAVTTAALESYRIQSMDAAHVIENALVPVTGRWERFNGVMEDIRGLKVLRMTRVPAVLVEVDFLSNRGSEQKLSRPAYRAAVAEAIGEGIMNYLRTIGEGE